MAGSGPTSAPSSARPRPSGGPALRGRVVLATALEVPGASPEDRRLQSRAVVSHCRRDRERALTLLDELADRFTDTGIPQNDEPNTRFASGFRELLGA